MLIAADLNREGYPPESTQIQFTINGTSKYTPYAESLPAGSYHLVFPISVTVGGITYSLLGSNDFNISHPEYAGETYFKASYFENLPPPPPPPPPDGNGDGVVWPVVKQKHILEVLEGGWGLGVSKNCVVGPVDMAKILGGKLDFTLTYQSAFLPGVTAKIYWNETMVFTSFLQLGVPLTGSVDITGGIGATNSLKIAFSQGPGSFSVVAFDIWVSLGFSAEPAIDPGITPEDDGWEKYLPYIAIGGGLLLLLLMGRGPSVVVVGNKRA